MERRSFLERTGLAAVAIALGVWKPSAPSLVATAPEKLSREQWDALYPGWRVTILTPQSTGVDRVEPGTFAQFNEVEVAE